MVSLQTTKAIVNNTKNYTRNGRRLVSKNTGLKLDENLKKVLENLPKNIDTLDIVKIETNFGNNSQKILSFKDKAGKLVKRIVSKYEGDKLTSRTINSYQYYSNNYKTVSRQTHVNGKLVSEVREQFGLNKDANNLLSHTKLTIAKDNKNTRYEQQVFETFTKKSRDRRYLETEAQRNSKGHMVKKSLNGNLENLENLSSDPYLYIRNYNDKDFFNAASNYAKKVQQVENRSINISNKSISNDTLGYSRSIPGYKEIKVDVAKHSSRGELVDTVNHELRHQYQDKIMEEQGVINYIFNRDSPRLTKEENKKARIFRKAEFAYSQPDKNLKKYYNNELEKDARNAGSKAEEIYNESSRKLLEAFPNAEPRLFGLKTNYLNSFLSKLFHQQKVLIDKYQ